jgi:hypothetical protein
MYSCLHASMELEPVAFHKTEQAFWLRELPLLAKQIQSIDSIRVIATHRHNLRGGPSLEAW